MTAYFGLNILQYTLIYIHSTRYVKAQWQLGLLSIMHISWQFCLTSLILMLRHLGLRTYTKISPSQPTIMQHILINEHIHLTILINRSLWVCIRIRKFLFNNLQLHRFLDNAVHGWLVSRGLINSFWGLSRLNVQIFVFYLLTEKSKDSWGSVAQVDV